MRSSRRAADRVARGARRGRALPPRRRPLPRRSPRCQLRSFDCPCALYPEADEAQRAQISATFAREAEQSTRTYARINGRVASRERARDYLSNLIFYMRRLSSSMGSGYAASRLRLELWPRRRSCTSARTTATSWSRWPFCTTPRGERGSTLTPTSGRWPLWRGPRRGVHARLSGAGRSRHLANRRDLLVIYGHGASRAKPQLGRQSDASEA
jgi:hypothetical protein